MGMIPLSSANIPIIAIGSLYIGSNVSTPTELVIGANGKVLTSNGTTPVWSDIPTTSWSSITGKPTFATVATSGSYSDLLGIPSTFTPSAHNQAWSTITSTPTTLSGYGISDGQPLDGDLTAIAALAGTSGFLKKTGTNTWTLDTSTYITSSQVITYASTASTSSLALDLSNQQSLYLISALAANLTLTTSNRTAGKVYGVRIKDNGTARNLTFPAWTWMRPAPTSTVAGKWIVVTIECFGTNDTDIIADWTTEDANVYTTYGRSLLTGADAAATRTLLGLATVAASGSAADLTGTLADLRLSANVGLLSVANTWSANQTIQTTALARVMARSTGTGTSASTNYAAVNVQNNTTQGITLGIGCSTVTSTLFGLVRAGLGELITDNSAAGLLIAHAHTSGDLYLALSNPGIALQLVNSSLSTGSAQIKYTTAATSTTAAALTVAGGLGVGGGAVFGGLITIERASSANGTFQSRVVGDSVARCLFEAGGRLLWSSGSSAGDTTLYRSASGTLKTDGVFQVASTADGALSVSGKITAKAAVPASFADLAAVRTYLASIIT